MAEKEGPVHSAITHTKWFFAILAVIVFLWFYTGGYERNRTSRSPLLIPPVGSYTNRLGTTENTTQKETKKSGFWFAPNTVKLAPDGATNDATPPESTRNNPNNVTPQNTSNKVYTIKQTDIALKNNIETSRYVKAVSIENYSGLGNVRSNEEYVTIRASANNTKKISLTGWQLKGGVYGQSIDIIGQGVYLPYLGSINVEQPIELSPGQKAIIVTGRSPTGVSFRENLCTGYFEQHQDFKPSLPIQCPAIRDENIPADPHGFNNFCLDTLDRIPRCQVFTKFTAELTPECQRFIINYNNYTGCVNLHKNEPKFYGNTWRIFLGQDKSIWHTKREIIELVDPAGKIVDTVSF